uniref:AB hydrolase-1 domain-containing protein n=1 Tax=Ascaris lumbricoides TaxID=6252 RepID=A0A0M3ID15_ASCLU
MPQIEMNRKIALKAMIECVFKTRMSVYLTHMPGGTSTANLVHWAQLTTTRRLRMYDFGSEYANMQRYGTPVPPAYEFRNISTPLYVYWSDADWLTDPRDVKRSLLDEIRPEYLAENNRLDNFNHFDFIWGAQVVERIYKPIIQTIKLASGKVAFLFM